MVVAEERPASGLCRPGNAGCPGDHQSEISASRLEVLRTYEPLWRRVLYRLTRRTTRHVTWLELETEEKGVARYEEFAPPQLPPYGHPTLYIAREPGGYPRPPVRVLHVTESRDIYRRDESALSLGLDAEPLIPVNGRVSVGATEVFRQYVRGPADLPVSFEVLTPDTEVGDLSLSAYIDRSLSDLAIDLEEDSTSRSPRTLFGKASSHGIRSTCTVRGWSKLRSAREKRWSDPGRI